jgi:acetyl esterase/lipase
MTLSLQARFWRLAFRMIFKNRRMTIAENRSLDARNGQFMGRIPSQTRFEKFELEGQPAAWIRPPGAVGDRVLIHFHGGGYVTGSIDGHRMLGVPLAQALKMDLLLPEYRLAPEHPFPAALQDALQAYRWLLAQGHAPGRILLSGDSAGGGLALAMLVALREAGEPLPAAAVLMSPWVDLTNSGRSHATRAKADAVLRTEGLREWALCYAGESKLDDPRVSPLHADLHGLPPLLIQVGSEEILLDDARRLAEKAAAQGVAVTLRVWEGMWHVWQLLGDFVPETRAAFKEIDDFIRQIEHGDGAGK